MRIIVHYTVKPETAGENIRQIKFMCDKFNNQQYDSLRYAVFKSADGITFYRLAFIPGDLDPLSNSTGFKAFNFDVAARCVAVAEPVLRKEVESYSFYTRDAGMSSSRQ